MANLIYYHGVMNSSKSAKLIMTAHNYTSTGRNILAMKPTKDTRDTQIASRVGKSIEAVAFSDEDDLVKIVKKHMPTFDIEAILIDEVQFCTERHIIELVHIVDELGIDVICYGLKSSYTGELFSATEKLLVMANKVYEEKQICNFCRNKATMNLKIKNEQPVYLGEKISVGNVKELATKDVEYYIPVCRKHFFNPLL